MKRWFAYTLFAALTVLITAGTRLLPAAHAQAAMQSSMAQSAAPTGKSHGTFTVELVKPLDSKKLKEGDEVEARLTGGITLPNGSEVARGSKVTGHVTEAKARSKGGSESSLGIVFDKIVRAPGEEAPIKGVLQAVAPNPNSEVTTGGYIGYGGLNEATQKPAAPDTRKEPTPILNDQSTGVLGIKNMQLGPDGVLTSSGKEVKLDGGTRILLNVTM
ncbi:MAG: hypothetical protein ABSD98_04790 [Candidatus Korobacteraceae bacterium]|jgi:hypothetical protein